MNEGFDYIGPTSISGPQNQPLTEGQAKDEEQLSTLEKLQLLIADRATYYRAIDSLDLDNKTFTVAEQLAINKQVLFHLQEFEQVLNKGIREVKERQNG